LAIIGGTAQGKKDTTVATKKLSILRETYQRLCRQINGMYESFALGEIKKVEYIAQKFAAVKQRDAAAARIAVLESEGVNGGLQNDFVSTFVKYTAAEEITGEITAEVLREVYIYPGERIEIVWNFRDELDKLMFDLQGDQHDD